MSVYRHPKSPFWYYSFRHAGKRYRGSTGKTGKREAEAEERSLRATLAQQSPVLGPRLTLADLGGLDVQRSQSEKRSTPEHLKALEVDWKHLCNYFGPDLEPDALRYPMVQGYITHRRAAGVKGQTICRELAALKRGCKTANKHGCHARPLMEWPALEHDEPDERLVGHLHEATVIGKWLLALHPEARAQATVAILTGLRATELRRLTWAWVDEGRGRLTVPPRGGKAKKKARTVGLPPLALSELRVLRDIYGTGPLMAHDHKKAYRNACKAIGYNKRITLRDLRHSFATLGLELNGDFTATQHAMGHTRPSTTSIYLSSTVKRVAEVGLALESEIFGHTPRPHSDTSIEKTEVESERATGFEPATPSLGILRRVLPGVEDRRRERVSETLRNLKEALGTDTLATLLATLGASRRKQ